ncbi:MAG: phospho-sugar mutase [Deltaproteobacteria bacterium]|nr:phospho-sugar mutase [Deltaproteobacteria bacterium]
MKTILDAARAHLAEDFDTHTLAELTALLARADANDTVALKDLEDRFTGHLVFGTAGLRGRVEAGNARMNRVVVAKATWGLGAWLLEHAPAHGVDARKQGVVIAFDGRLSSRTFAEDACAILCAQGIPVHLFLDPEPTPVCAFAVADLKAAAGIMVTASHNPPADNGYKVYWANAAQIVPPIDDGVMEMITKAPRANTIARMHPPEAAAAGLRRIIGDDLELRYLDAVARMSSHAAPAPGSEPLRIVYTAMHGVGHRLTIRSLMRAGFDGVVAVPNQSDPDGTFRTVAFPNPEEKGALDLALEKARETNADIVLANDPDADRLAAAVKIGVGEYRLLSGNEIGVLLCHDALTTKSTGNLKKLVITTIVSSTMLSRIAKDLGAAYEEVLTGFKWIANKAMEREKEGYWFCGGYEEAIGFSVGPIVRDKDGVGAAVRLAELARALKAENNKTLLDRLDDLAVAHGLSHGAQWSVTMPGLDGLSRIAGIMKAMRTQPPGSLDGAKVVRSVDLKTASIPADVVVLHTADGARLTVRPSGTEPKIKLYLELVAQVASTTELAAAKATLAAKAARIQAELKAALGV